VANAESIMTTEITIFQRHSSEALSPTKQVYFADSLTDQDRVKAAWLDACRMFDQTDNLPRADRDREVLT
jgi:hypothetical protein